MPCKDDKPKVTEITPFQAGSDYSLSATMKIIALKYGESVFGENYILKGGRKDIPTSFDVHLIDNEFSLS